MKRLAFLLREYALPCALIAGLLGMWEAAVMFWDIPSYVLPAPSGILRTTVDKADILFRHSLVTLAEIALGFCLALFTGIGLAVAIHASRTVERAFMPLIVASQMIPVFAIAPLLILWFGYGLASKVVMAAIIVFFPIVISTVEGLRAADPDLIALMKILEASPRQIFFKVRVPQSVPFVLSGVRIGIAVSVIGAVIGEWAGAKEGLGYLMIHANAQLKVELVFAAILWLSVIGTLLYALVGLVRRYLVPWRVK